VNKITVGIVDYKMGNHASVLYCLKDLGFRVRVSDNHKVLDNVDLLLLPGVGAFPSAMAALEERGLVAYLRRQAHIDRPIIGICLGMQLLADASYEYQYTEGLGLIPGEVVPLKEPKWHIGWNALECMPGCSILNTVSDKAFYFNHSYVFQCQSAHQLCTTHHQKRFPAIVRKDSVIGLQFHPEKSQAPGRELIYQLITECCHA